MRRWLRRIGKYAITLTVGIAAALALGTVLFWIAPYGGLPSSLLPLPWLAFSVILGALTLWVLLLPAAAGPLARLCVALIVSSAVFVYVEKGPQGGYFDRFGQLGFLLKPLGSWLANSGLDNFDSLLWRVSLLGGLLVLAAYPLIRASLGAALSWVGRLSLRSTDDKPNKQIRERERLTIAHFFTNLTIRHAMLGLTTASVMLLVLMLPILQAMENLANGAGWEFMRLLESGERVIWVAPLLIILELTAISLRDIPWRGNAAITPTHLQADETAVPRIKDLFSHLLSIAGDSVILAHPKNGARVAEPAQPARAAASRRQRKVPNGPAARVIEGMRRVSQLSPGRLGQIGGPLDQFLDPDDRRGAKRLAIAEAMTSDHYLLFAHLISHVLDDGGTFLVVAPDDLLPDVRSSLSEALSICGVGFAISEFDISSLAPPESELFNLIFVRESFLHSGLLSNSKQYAGFLERLRLIFLMETADMDLGWLRLRLLSLWQLANYRHTRIVMQSSSSVRLNEIIGLVATEGGSGDPIPITLASAAARATHVLMFDDTDDLREKIRRAVTSEVRVSTPVMLALEALLHDCPPIVYKTNLDPADVVHVESNWLNDVASLISHEDELDDSRKNSNALEALNRQLFRTHLRPTDAPATVIAWDTYNFLAVKDRNYNYFRAKDFLVQILSKPYPMRDFLRFYDEDPQGFDPGKRIIFLPHAPRLAGGVAELTYLTVEAMRRGKGLTRTQFKTILGTVTKGQFLQSAGIGNDVSGIDRLLELHQVANRFRVDSEIDSLTGERIFKLSGDGSNLRTQTLVLQRGKRIDDVDLDYSDRGLTFGVQTRIRIRHRIWGVASIEPNTIHLEVPPPRVNMPTYVFVNAYRFNSDLAPIVESTQVDRQPGSDLGRALLHASFRRATEQIYEYPSGDDPFADGRAPTLRSVAGQPWTSVERNLKCVAHLVLTGLSGIVPTGASPPGQPSMSNELARAAVALATCTMIKDTIASLFPDAAPRISVLSNQLRPMRKLLDQRREELKAVIGSKQLEREHLENQIELTQFLAGRVGYLAAPEPGLLKAWISEFPEKLDDPDDIIEIFVVEDSEWDLGVARAIVENDDILQAAACFCEVITNDEEVGGDGSYLRFGADIVRSFVYLPGANQILSRFARVNTRLSPIPSEGASP